MIVTKDKTAIAMGSGELEVFATPAMVALMENLAMIHAKTLCTEAQTTVGIYIQVNHNRATPIGAQVRATVELVEQLERKLVYKVVATDEKGEIGNAVHHRFIVDRAKFMSKI